MAGSNEKSSGFIPLGPPLGGESISSIPGAGVHLSLWLSGTGIEDIQRVRVIHRDGYESGGNITLSANSTSRTSAVPANTRIRIYEVRV